MVLLKDFVLLVGVAFLATCSSQEVGGHISGRDAGSLGLREAENPLVKLQQEASASKSLFTTKSTTTTALPSTESASSTTTRKGSKPTGVPESQVPGKQDSQLDKWEKMIMNFIEQLKNALSNATGQKKDSNKQNPSKDKSEKPEETTSTTSTSTTSTLSSTSTRTPKPSNLAPGSPLRDFAFPQKDQKPARKLSERDATLQSFLSQDSDRAAEGNQASGGPYDRNDSFTSPQDAPHTNPNGTPGMDLKPELPTDPTLGTTPKGSSDILAKSSTLSSTPSQEILGTAFMSADEPEKARLPDPLYHEPQGPGAASQEDDMTVPWPESQRQYKSDYPSRNGGGRGRQRQKARNPHRKRNQRRHHQGSYLPSQQTRGYGFPAGRIDSPRDNMGYPTMRYGDLYSYKMYPMSSVPMDGVPRMRGAAPALRPPPILRFRGLRRRRDLTTDETNNGVPAPGNHMSQGLPTRPNQYKPSRPGGQSKSQRGKGKTTYGAFQPETRPQQPNPSKQKSKKPTSPKPFKDPNSSSRFNNHHEMIQMQRRLAKARKLASRAANPASSPSRSEDHLRSRGRANVNPNFKPADTRSQLVNPRAVYPRMSKFKAEAYADAEPEADFEGDISERGENVDDGLSARNADAEAEAEAEAETEAEAEAEDVSELVTRDADAEAEAEAENDYDIYAREADPEAEADADADAEAEAVMAISKIPINSPVHNLVGEA